MRGLYSVHSQEVFTSAPPRSQVPTACPYSSRYSTRSCARLPENGQRVQLRRTRRSWTSRGVVPAESAPPVCQSCDSRFPDRIPPAGSAKAVHASRSTARAAAPSDRTQIRQLGARHLCGPGRSRLSILPLAMALCTPQWPLVAFGLRRTAAQRSPGRCRCP